MTRIGFYSLGTQSAALEASSIELSVVQNSRSVALRLLQLFWSRKIIACKTPLVLDPACEGVETYLLSTKVSLIMSEQLNVILERLAQELQILQNTLHRLDRLDG